jgi:signal-transduction protein with cAMP-binding, CBS, and nucleotidyltransferase domain
VSALLDWLARPAAAAMQPDPSVVLAGTALATVAAVLHRSDPPAALVVDATGRAVGLIDATMLLGLAFAAGGATPVEQVMDGPDALAPAALPLHQAAAKLRRERRRWLGLVDGAGRPAGLLSGEDALAPLAFPLAGLLAAGGTGTAAGRAALAAALLHDGQEPASLQAGMAALNDELMRRVVGDAERGLQADGWGPAPVPFTFLLMGSGGRRESFLYPDQDNGLILAPYPDEQHTAVDRWFVALAERTTRALDAAGFPLCPGNVMATNPVWRKPFEQWVAQIAGWAVRRSPQAVLAADIFLDFRALGGAEELGAALRREVLRICAEYPLFPRQLCWEHIRQGMPLGLFGQLQGEPGAAHADAIDLKLRASLPMVGLIRMLALRHGIAATGTLERLHALVGLGRIGAELGAALEEDFHALTALRLRQQIADAQAGRPVGNYLTLAGLAERDRHRLVGLFRTLDLLRRAAAQEFGGRMG